MTRISDRDWFAIREAARRQDWAEVEERALALGWLIVAKHARRAAVDFASLAAVVWGLKLNEPDAPDPFVKEVDDRAS